MKSVLLFLILLGLASSPRLVAQGMPPNFDVVIVTDSGNIYIELFEDTPLHRANFLKLAREGFYNGTTFHRVVQDFMIQGGDPCSRPGGNPDSVGMGGPDYAIPAEIRRNYLHTFGALCAARMADDMNPLRESNGSQFYIVTGKKIEANKIEQVVRQVQNAHLQGFRMQVFEREEYGDIRQQLDSLGSELMVIQQRINQQGDGERHLIQQLLTEDPEFNAKYDVYKSLADSICNIADSLFARECTPFTYTPNDLSQYQSVGGAPFLDMQYTVFGRVVSGMEVVMKIVNVEKAPESIQDPYRERPLHPIRILEVRVME